jgi:hypothetical protein
MTGVNRARIPDGKVTVQKNGDLQVETPGGAKYGLRANGSLASCSNQGNTVGFHPSGMVSSVRSPSLNIERGNRGNTSITSPLRDNTTLASAGRSKGFLQSTVSAGSQNLTQRSWLIGGKLYNRLYTSGSFRGHGFLNYVPGAYYSSAFYSWVYYPWDPAVQYTWPWAQDDWYTSYSSYFTPSSQYQSASDWLTDYVVARTLSDNYADDTANTGQASQDASPRAAGENPISDDVRSAIRSEIQGYLTRENALASGADQASADDLGSTAFVNWVFLYPGWRTYTWNDQSTCDLSPGDTVRITRPLADDTNLGVAVVASNKKADCSVNNSVKVRPEELAEMLSNLRSQVDAGLQELRAEQGQNGLPSAPPAALMPARMLVPQPPADTSDRISSMLSGLRDDASRNESGIVASTCPGIR